MNDFIPKVGQYLHSSCAGDDYGRIIAVGFDGNNTPTVDLEVFQLTSLLSFDDDEENPVLTTLEVEPNTKLILRHVQYKYVGEGYGNGPLVEFKTPGDGCYRCTSLFSLQDKPTP